MAAVSEGAAPARAKTTAAAVSPPPAARRRAPSAGGAAGGGQAPAVRAAGEGVRAVPPGVAPPHPHARLDLVPLEVRDADEADLAVLDQLVEGADRLLEGDRAVRPVHEVDVDIVGAEVLEG